jgi:uncharacterized repeat protein (TIGR03847 family)
VPRQIHAYVDPRRFVAGTVGLPGERTFYLQASDDRSVTSVALEKAQVAMLADRIGGLLAQAGIPETAGTDDHEALALPLEEEFRVGTLGIAWLPDGEDGDRVLVEAHALGDEEAAEPGDDDDDAADTLRVLLRPDAAASFVRRARTLVAAGRPPCPFCLQPLDPAGHVCPRANGYRRRV